MSGNRKHTQSTDQVEDHLKTQLLRQVTIQTSRTRAVVSSLGPVPDYLISPITLTRSEAGSKKLETQLRCTHLDHLGRQELLQKRPVREMLFYRERKSATGT